MSEVAKQTSRAGGVLAATCISTLVVNANTSAVSILLPAISDDTGMSVDTLQWAVTGYSLVGAAVIITSGSLGDVFGRKRIFQLGLLLFVVSCVLIALAQGGELVIAGRLIQGAAGATILACGLSLLTVATSDEEQLRAVSLWGAAAAVGAAAGPLLGGVLVEVTGWQGLFWIDAGVAVGVHGADLRDGGRVARSRPAEVDRLRRHRAGRAHPDAADPRASARAATGAGSPWRPWAASPSRSRPASPSSRSSSGWRSLCWISSCCATGSWSAPRSPS